MANTINRQNVSRTSLLNMSAPVQPGKRSVRAGSQYQLPKRTLQTSAQPRSSGAWAAESRPAASPALNGSRSPAFPAEVISAAQASERKWGVPASVTLAQWALESDYGKKMPQGSNNPFGIKAAAGPRSVSAATHEEVQGRMIQTQAAFRKYDSLAEAFDDHGRLLGTSRYYAGARQHRDNPDAFAASLTGVYATDSAYGSKLQQVMQDYNLYQYDGAAQAPGAADSTLSPAWLEQSGAAHSGEPRRYTGLINRGSLGGDALGVGLSGGGGYLYLRDDLTGEIHKYGLYSVGMGGGPVSVDARIEFGKFKIELADPRALEGRAMQAGVGVTVGAGGELAESGLRFSQGSVVDPEGFSIGLGLGVDAEELTLKYLGRYRNMHEAEVCGAFQPLCDVIEDIRKRQ